MNDPSKKRWLEKAQALEPKLHTLEVTPVAICRIEKGEDSFAGWKAAPESLSALDKHSYRQGESAVFDFGDHHVGYLSFDLACKGELDSPARLQLTFAELPPELGEPFDPFTGELSRSWLQDEELTFDLLPLDGEALHVELPRRYAFRYVRIKMIGGPAYALYWWNLVCRTVTAADSSKVVPVDLPPRWARMDEVSRRTLRNCMQTVFEDGPKRDRRLWLGDLRLQAMANAVTFKNFDLVKRCLYLFAGLTREDGLVNGCLYEKPVPHGSGSCPLDYALLFGPTLLEYARESGDWQTARELWPVALRQLSFGWVGIDEKGIWRNQEGWWIFVDWNDQLIKEGILGGILAFSIRHVLLLAESLSETAGVEVWKERLSFLTAGTREEYWNRSSGLVVCGGQVSWLAQAWLSLGGILSREEGARALKWVLTDSSTTRPISPYGCHTVVEALLNLGMEKEAAELLDQFWGGMLDLGADTFWEVWDPSNHRASPYKNFLLNSACHAWSCTPTYFLRRWPQLARI